MVPELSSLPNGTPIWITIALVVLSAILTFSERVAKISGPIGAAARWWTSRQASEVKRSLSLEETINDSVEKRVQMRMEPIQGQITDMRDRIRTLQQDLNIERSERKKELATERVEHRKTIARLQAERDLYVDWSAHLQAWWRPVQLWIADRGLEIPPPKYPAFAEFRAEWERKNKSVYNYESLERKKDKFDD